MARTIWCRWPACQKPTKLLRSWMLPDQCPECHNTAMWTTEPPHEVTPPSVVYELSHNDRRFLKSLRIAAEDEDDGA